MTGKNIPIQIFNKEKKQGTEEGINFRNEICTRSIYVNIGLQELKGKRKNAEGEGRGRIFDRTRAKLPVSNDRKLETNF